MLSILLNQKIKQKIKKLLPKRIVEVLISLKYSVKNFPNEKIYVDFVEGKKGIEIGGPSVFFKTVLPLYQKASDLDVVNFSNNTVWEGGIQTGQTFKYFGNKKGHQYIYEATDLSQINSNTYDFLLSSNCLEHIANPLKALFEWKRVIKPGGALILILPNKVGGFDHNRPYTSFEHILDDFNDDTTEYDLTHLDEILELHDLSMDLKAGDLESFKKRSLDNFNNRTLHHHVFEMTLIKNMLNFIEFDVVESFETNNGFIALATKRYVTHSTV